MTNLAIFVSGSGTNCENIIRYFTQEQPRRDVRIALVLSNKSDAYALVRAQNLNVPTVVMEKRQFHDGESVLKVMKEYEIDFIVLAGFLLMIPDFLLRAYPRRIVNIHPSLLPKYGGKGMWGHHVHEAVYEAKEKESGITIHWVSEVCDGGEIIAQFKTPLSPEDTPDDIADKVHVLEMKNFPKVIEEVIQTL